MSSPGPAAEGGLPVRANATNHLDRAIAFVTRAIEDDTNRNYAAAYKGYQNSLDYFMLALKYETNDKAKSLIRMKTSEYLRRAEVLKEYLTKPQQKGSSQSLNSGEGGDLPSNHDVALAYAEEAMKEDRKANYKKAAELYEICVDNFLIAIKHEKSENMKSLSHKQMVRYREQLIAVKKTLAQLELGGESDSRQDRKDSVEELESHIRGVSLHETIDQASSGDRQAVDSNSPIVVKSEAGPSDEV